MVPGRRKVFGLGGRKDEPHKIGGGVALKVQSCIRVTGVYSVLVSGRVTRNNGTSEV